MLVPLSSESPCPGCGQTTSGPRCGQCGVALQPGGHPVQRILSQKKHGRTYLATDVAGRDLAVKEQLFSTPPTLRDVEAFAGESAVLNRLDNPQLPKFFPSFSEGEGADTRFYLVQRYIKGESLETRLRSGPLSESDVVAIAEQVLGILRYLHGTSPKVAHGDVKPANLIRDERDKLWLVDFKLWLVDVGAWRFLQSSEAAAVPEYWPSEGPYDETAELYALGLTLVQLLTGRNPHAIVQWERSVPASAFGPASPPLQRWLSHLVAPRARRYDSADIALRALQPVKRGEIRRTFPPRRHPSAVCARGHCPGAGRPGPGDGFAAVRSD